MSLALGQPQGCTGASLNCSRARNILGTLQPFPEKTTCCFPYRFSGKSKKSDFVPGNRDPNSRIGHTPKGSSSPRGRSRHLLETLFSEPLLRTLLRTLFYCKNHRKPTSQNPSENPSPEPFPEPSQNPS